jgi:hypothetical protein
MLGTSATAEDSPVGLVGSPGEALVFSAAQTGTHNPAANPMTIALYVSPRIRRFMVSLLSVEIDEVKTTLTPVITSPDLIAFLWWAQVHDDCPHHTC